MAVSTNSLERPLTPKTALTTADSKDAGVNENPSVLKPIPNREYVTGYKLYIIVAAVAFVSFLMLLDNMIVSTVRRDILEIIEYRKLILL
jgi:hypothetical protein